MKVLKPFLYIIILVSVVSMACSFGADANTPTNPPQQQQSEPTTPPEPTQAPEPTKEPEPTQAPDPTATELPPAASDFYREEFEGDISNFSYFEYHEEFENAATDKDIVPTTDGGYLVFDLKKTNKEAFKNKILPLAEKALAKNYSFIILTSNDRNDINNFVKELKINENIEFYSSDDTSLKAMIRSNPGLVLLKNAVVLGKWHYRNIPDFEKIDFNKLEKKYLKTSL